MKLGALAAASVFVGAGLGTIALGQTAVRLASREAIEGHLKGFSTNNVAREGLIRKWLAEVGCKGKNLSEQYLPAAFAVEGEFPAELPGQRSPGGHSGAGQVFSTPSSASSPGVSQGAGASREGQVEARQEASAEMRLPPNVICVLPGETQEVILVSAHTDHVDTAGEGVVDNWSGASLLPSLVYSLEAQRRRHTFVFVGFSAEEKGLTGSAYYAEHLTAKQRARVAGVVNLDSLGLGPTEVWASHADKPLLDALTAVAAANKLPASTMNVDDLGTADSESFARYQIQRITLHSVTRETWAVLHSSRDKLSAIRMDDYYDSYRLIALYLADLDGELR